ncbi:glycosyltransferase [candidate division KSB1 bacterium]|nr:MAG: glycosyltransferase [candidate division KSB1 bacterium]MBC6948431.1 glycosyltransferase [candidate division KSB1 bacterium]MCE7940197.1 glycosyltransferase [Chlorobi bacterium CHB1]MDL1873866.1 glycosyltransferase [Cytophagia bacterium CHB2]
MKALKLQNEHSKILILIKGLGLGGAERLIVDSLPYLNREQFDYEFAYMLPWKDFLVPTITKASFPVHCLGMQKTWHFPLMQRRLQKLMRDRRFDLIHADLPVTGILARLMGRRFGIPVIYTEHNLQERYHPVTRRANALTFGWNDCVLAVSEEVAASIKRCGLEKKTTVKTLLNGVPVEQVRAEAGNVNGLREEFGIPKNNLVVGTVAVFRRQKRLQDWLEVASRIVQQQGNVTFLLVGHGPEEAMLRSKISELGIEDRVVMPGFRRDGRRVMALMDVFLMTSEFEGLPMALLEAMALAKPVVATSVGGIPELVKNGDEGFLTLVGAVDELAGYATKLLGDPQLRLRMGERGAVKVEENFHIKHRVKFIEALYWEVLAEKRRTGDGVRGRKEGTRIYVHG